MCGERMDLRIEQYTLRKEEKQGRRQGAWLLGSCEQGFGVA